MIGRKATLAELGRAGAAPWRYSR